MAVYCIGYDLMRSGKDYKDLIPAIKTLGTWWHCLDSTWLVVTNLTAEQIVDKLSAYLDADDKMLVFPVGSGWWSKGLSDECLQWLHKNMP